MFERNSLIDEGAQGNGEAGISLRDVGRSVMIWASMNFDRRLTVSECATTFNTGADVIRDAVAKADWVLLIPDGESDPTRQFIEVDGE